MRLVLFKLNALGDNVVFLPGVQQLRRLHPDWHLTVVTTPGQAELYGGARGPQEVLTSPKLAFDKAYRRPWVLAEWAWRIRSRHPDACLLAFDQASVPHLVALLSGARVRVGANLDFVRVPGSVTQEVAMPADARPSTWNWSMAAALDRALGGGADWPSRPPRPDLRHLLSKGSRPKAERRRVLVHAGASKRLNQWPRDRFAAVALALSRDFEVVWIEHGPRAGPAPGGTVAAPVSSLSELASWIAGSDLVLCNNSGPMHLANALGCRGVSVTGPSAPGWDPCWEPERWRVLRHPALACSPCERPDRELLGCANLAHPMACLDYWSPERVEVACRESLSLAP